MNKDSKYSHEILPSVGWATLRLGQSIDEVQASIKELGITAKVMDHDKFMWYAEEPGVSLQFVGGEPPRLANIVLSDGPMIVNGTELLGLRIDEVLVALGIRSYSDTMWSIMDSEDEFEGGIPMSDSDQPTGHDTIELLRYGTLWIHSLGLGLGMNDAHVAQVAIRNPHDTPKMGCGPLSEETLITATDPQFKETVAAIHAEIRQRVQSSPSLPIRRTTRLVLGAIALALFCVPVFLMYHNYSRWSKARQVTGKIVAVAPDTFPDYVKVEYSMPNEEFNTIELPVAYASTREVGGEVELLHPVDEPTKVVTLSQRYDQIFDGYSPHVLLISPAIALFLTALAFPELTWTKRRDYIK